jgi:hypothetical protein
LVKPGGESSSKTAAEPYGVGEGTSFPENQVDSLISSLSEKTDRPKDDVVGMESGVKGRDVESKEGEVGKAGKGSFNAVYSGSEALGDSLKCSNQTNLCQVANKETTFSRMQGLLDKNCGPLNDSSPNVNPGLPGPPSDGFPPRDGLSPAHRHSICETEELLIIGPEKMIASPETQEPSLSLMQTAESEMFSYPTMQPASEDQSTKKAAKHTWQRRAREHSSECFMVQGGKRKNADSLSLSLDDKGSEVKKQRKNNLALAEAELQPRLPQ